MKRNVSITFILSGLLAATLSAQTAITPDQTKTGAGNAQATTTAQNSAMVQSSLAFLVKQANRIQDFYVRFMTIDAITSSNVCVFSRANVTAAQKTTILQKLTDQGLINPTNAAAINGGAMAGVFPPLVNDGTGCPTPPQPYYSAPGGATNGHHSYPGGLPIHTNANLMHAVSLADDYRLVYGNSQNGFPVTTNENVVATRDSDSEVFVSEDLMIAAPIWHDWAKHMVFQWNADGTEFVELSFGGNGSTDKYGAAGDSRTGAHHIITIAELMARSMPVELIITMASAHNTPTNGDEYKVVNWIRTAAILAQVDPVARGYLMTDTSGNLRLPAVRSLGSIDLLQGNSLAHTNALPEYVLHNLSDADFILTGPALAEVLSMLQKVAPQFGANPTDLATYNVKFRNPVMSNIPAERLMLLYSNGGINAVAAEINKIRSKLN